MRVIVIAVAELIAAAAAYLLAWPTSIDPLAFQPPTPPAMQGALAPNTALRAAELVGVGQFNGPEDVAVDREGRIYSGTDEGVIKRLSTDGKVEIFAETGGRPLGLAFDADGNLIVADSGKGLLSITPDGKLTVLTTSADDLSFGFTDDVTVGNDGTIYFTDASHRFGQADYMLDLLESRPNGRLLKYDPASKTTEMLLDGLYFANGVALSADEDFILVNETYRYRIMRYWLKGEKTGTADVFMDNLPGFPDNISSTGDGRFWLALVTVRNTQMDEMHPKPWLKKIISRLPRALWPQPEPYGLVLELDEQANILRSLQDPGGQHLPAITSVNEVDGKLYLGSLYTDRIGVLTLKP